MGGQGQPGPLCYAGIVRQGAEGHIAEGHKGRAGRHEEGLAGEDRFLEDGPRHASHEGRNTVENHNIEE